jgi:hypothetical protein
MTSYEYGRLGTESYTLITRVRLRATRWRSSHGKWTQYGRGIKNYIQGQMMDFVSVTYITSHAGRESIEILGYDSKA